MSNAGSKGRNTAVLFAGTSFYSRRVLVPLNQCALKEIPNLPQIFCVHSISGNAGADFLALAERLEPHVRLYGVQAPPALMPDTEFGKSIESIAAYYAETLDDFQPTGDFHIAGFCVGAVIALAIVNELRSRGREVGLLVAIDGVPENTPFALGSWRLRYWIDMAQNALFRARNPKMFRRRSIRTFAPSIRSNLRAIAKNFLGMNRAQKFGGGYSVEFILDLTRYPPARVSFVNRLFAAIFEYNVTHYSGEVIVYEAEFRPLFYLPQIGRIWSKLASRTELVSILATHDQMMREPYVDAVADDLIRRMSQKGYVHFSTVQTH